MARRIVKNPFSIFLLFMVFIFAGCKKDNSSSIDFSYTGSQYRGGTLHFAPNTSAGGSSLWDFGDSTASAITAPDHVYTHGGTFTVSLTMSGRVVSKMITIGVDSVHQSLIAKTWMWHKQTDGYYPPAQKDTVYHLADLSATVYSLAPGVILMIKDTLFFASSTDSTINFSSVHYYGSPSSTPANAWSIFQYNFNTNQVSYQYRYHVSAGAGDWTDTYNSF